MRRKRRGSPARGPLAKRVCSRWMNVSYQLRLDGVKRPAHVPDSVGSTSCQSTTTETKLVSEGVWKGYTRGMGALEKQAVKPAESTEGTFAHGRAYPQALPHRSQR